MALPETEYPVCPKHELSMVPHAFDTRDKSLLQGTVQGFRCPNLACSIVHVEGTLAGFYILEPSGHMPPYLKLGQNAGALAGVNSKQWLTKSIAAVLDL